ncbi:MAG: ketoacyl-ACP synthase III [Fidelibacterota bacterium]|nr:MAG: ketoacyl-ACP synthase III [Candidatus Neomarinimicrobiota bacterium]
MPLPPNRTAKITAVGKYLPERVITNFDLEKLVDTTDEWIRTRTGIIERRQVGDGEATSHMATAAARDLLEKRQIDPEEIDCIIVATVTPDMFFPATACLVQNNLGASRAWGYDLSAACSGFLFALDAGARMIESGSSTKVMVIGADTMSSIIDYTDRATCVLFGDGAGAVLLEACEEGNEGILDSILRCDGSGAEYLCMEGGGSLHPPRAETVAGKKHYLYQDGRIVFKYAIKLMADITAEVAQRNGLKSEDIQLFIPHQANQRIIDASVERLGLREDQVLSNIDYYANTTAATIPLGMADAVEQGRLKPGDNVVLAAFGAGFTWGGIYLRWSEVF